MIAILSPAKSLDFDFDSSPYERTTPQFMDDADYLARKLKSYSSGKIGKLMGLSKPLSELNHDRYQTWEVPHDTSSKPALWAFRGDVYRGIDAGAFSKKEASFAQKHLRILSGLYGLLRPTDYILPYRLEMGTGMQITSKKKGLYKYWGDQITEALNAEAEEGNAEFIVNLASNEYFKAVNPKTLKPELLTCQFKDAKNGEFKTIMTYAKLARGYMARYIVKNGIVDKNDLKGFDIEGYGYNDRLSTPNEWVFTRG